MKKIIILGLIIISVFTFSSPLLAQTPTPTTQTAQSLINPNDPGYSEGDYELDDFMRIAINVSNLILRFVGSLALLMFIYGGFTFLLSGGSSDKVSKGKNILVAAVIGLVIVFSSFLIIKFALKTVGVEWNGQVISQTE